MVVSVEGGCTTISVAVGGGFAMMVVSVVEEGGLTSTSTLSPHAMMRDARAEKEST